MKDCKRDYFQGRVRRFCGLALAISSGFSWSNLVVAQETAQQNEPVVSGSTNESSVKPTGSETEESNERFQAEVSDVLRKFYEQIRDGKADESVTLFADSNAVITSRYRPPFDRVHHVRSLTDYAKQYDDGPIHLRIETLDVDVIGPGMAVGKVNFTTSGTTTIAVATVINEGEGWRLVALHEENCFVW